MYVCILTLYWGYQDVHCIPWRRRMGQFLVEELPVFFENHRKGEQNCESTTSIVSNDKKKWEHLLVWSVTWTMATWKRTPLRPTAKEAAAMTAGPMRNLTAIEKAAVEFPHAMILGCKAMNKPVNCHHHISQSMTKLNHYYPSLLCQIYLSSSSPTHHTIPKVIIKSYPTTILFAFFIRQSFK